MTENRHICIHLYSHATFSCSAIPNVQIDSKDFIDDLHPIYGLYTLGDEDVIEHKPHAPQYECDLVATDLLDK
jgi:hypothetical protein